MELLEPTSILVVEDEEDISVPVKAYLEKHLDVKVVVTRDCASARRALGGETFDVVTLDNKLPDGDGLDLMAEILKLPGPPKVIVATGKGDEATAVKAFKKGATSYVVKDRRLLDNLLSEVRSAQASIALERVEKALEESTRLSRLYFENTSDVLCAVGRDMVLLNVSPSVEKTLGFRPDELTGRRLTETGIIAEESLEQIAADVGRVLEGETVTGSEYTFISKSGERRFGEVSGVPHVKDGEVVGLVAVARDITEHRLAEEALRRSEEKYRKLVRTSPDAITTADLEGKITMVSAEALEILGYDEEELTGRSAFELFSPEDRDKAEEAMARTLEEGFVRDEEYAFVRADGSTFPGELSAALIEDGEGNPEAFMAVVRDITERKRAERQVEKSAEDLRDLIDVAAHELRHPATVFKGYATLLLEHWHSMDEESIRDALLEIDDATDRLTHIVVELLDASKIERRQFTLTRDEVLPSAPLVRAVEELMVRGCKNELNVDPPSHEIKIDIDANRVTSAVGFILENAVKYSEPGSPVDLWYEEHAGEVVYHIADRGVGVEEKHRERIFDRFYQVEDAAHHSLPGIGLGLYITKNIVEAHGGWIRVDSREGGGSVFSFGIPR